MFYDRMNLESGDDMTEEMKKIVEENFLRKEESISRYATKSSDAIRLFDRGEKEDIRPAYYHDIDRIIHSLSYTRYLDKTQVFSFQGNDHISKRIIHVQLVSKIARTIARALNLNEDLTEAIALGHDIGHTPIGHTGEAILDMISMETIQEHFGHNFQSVRTYMTLEKDGLGSNLTIQVLDGIMCHNGEILEARYVPAKKTTEKFLKEYQQSYTNLEIAQKIRPMTLEGCVVRISDLIGYLGRDIEDAIELGVLSREQLPKSITSVLGNNNKSMIDVIIQDIIIHSLNQPYIEMSEEVFRAMKELKDFNYKNIYNKANTKESIEILKIQFRYLFDTYLNDLIIENKTSEIYTFFLNHKNDKYNLENKKERIVIDFIAGMTDKFFLECYNKHK